MLGYDFPQPEAPSWAIEAGIPLPGEREGFRDYVLRLGIDPTPMLDGLTERTAVLANIRLSSRLADEMPDVWNAHLRKWIASVRQSTL